MLWNYKLICDCVWNYRLLWNSTKLIWNSSFNVTKTKNHKQNLSRVTRILYLTYDALNWCYKYNYIYNVSIILSRGKSYNCFQHLLTTLIAITGNFSHLLRYFDKDGQLSLPNKRKEILSSKYHKYSLNTSL